MFNPVKIPAHFSEHLYARQVRFVQTAIFTSKSAVLAKFMAVLLLKSET